MHEFVPNEGDAYSWFSEALTRFFEEALSHPEDDPPTTGRRVNVLDAHRPRRARAVRLARGR